MRPFPKITDMSGVFVGERKAASLVRAVFLAIQRGVLRARLSEACLTLVEVAIVNLELVSHDTGMSQPRDGGAAWLVATAPALLQLAGGHAISGHDYLRLLRSFFLDPDANAWARWLAMHSTADGIPDRTIVLACAVQALVEHASIEMVDSLVPSDRALGFFDEAGDRLTVLSGPALHLWQRVWQVGGLRQTVAVGVTCLCQALRSQLEGCPYRELTLHPIAPD